MSAIKRIGVKTLQNISVKDFLELYGEQLKLELLAGNEGLYRLIEENTINRPALALTGYFKHFGQKRLQFFGSGEMSFINDLDEKRQTEIIREIAKKDIPCMIMNKEGEASKGIIKTANQYKIPLMRSELLSNEFMTECTLILKEIFAQKTLVHGTLMDIKGIGVLLEGRSGVGKSECALALLERGYSLIADDVTYFRKMGDTEIMGHSSSLNREYMECRGLGIINVVQLFGIRSFRPEKRLDLIITFVEWNSGMEEERTGLDRSFKTILGVEIPHVKIPVRPGRDMARLVEVAALVQSLKNMGHDPAVEFNEKLIAHMSKSQVQD